MQQLDFRFQSSSLFYASAISYQSYDQKLRIALGGNGTNKFQKLEILECDQQYMNLSAEIRHGFMPLQIQFLNQKSLTNDYLVTASDQLRLFKYDHQEQVLNLEAIYQSKSRAYCGPTLCFDIHPIDINKMVSGSIDSTVSLWDLHTKKCSYQTIAHEGKVSSISFSISPDIFVTVGDDKFVGLIDLRFPSIHKIINNNKIINYEQLSWNKFNNNQIAVVDREAGFIDLFDLRMTYGKYNRIRSHNGYICKADFIYPKENMISAGEDGQIYLYNTTDIWPDYGLQNMNEIFNFSTYKNTICYTTLFGAFIAKF